MARIIFLGTSASVPSKDRDNTSFVFCHNKQTVLVDCPGGVSHKLLKAGIDFTAVRHVIITHHHPDHLYGILSLIHTQGHLNDSLTIYTTRRSQTIIKKLVALFGLEKKQYPRIRYKTVMPEEKVFFNKGGLQIRALRNTHVEGSFGIRFSFGAKALFYSSDTAFVAPMLKKAQPFNWLIHDCTASSSYFKKHPRLFSLHTNSLQLADYVKNAPAIKLIPVHFLLLEKGEEGKIKNELKRLGSRCAFAGDFQQILL